MSASGYDFPATYAEALRAAKAGLQASRELTAKGTVEAEAELIVLHLIRELEGRMITRAELVDRLPYAFPESAGARLGVLCGTRAEGKPLQHLLGYQFFYSHEYQVSPDALIPRPETEILVESALTRLRGEKPSLGLEIGLGSGAVSVELLSDQPQLRMLASELRPEAARLGRANADQILGAASAGSAGKAERLRILEVAGATQVLEPFRAAMGDARADFLISNPPYMTAEDGIEREVLDYEPKTALFAPVGDPLFFYRQVAEQAGDLLKPGAWVWMETPHERAEEILELFDRERGWEFACLIRDLNQHQRVLEARRSDEK